MVALAHSDRDVVLYSREGGKQLATLDQHDLRVTGIFSETGFIELEMLIRGGSKRWQKYHR